MSKPRRLFTLTVLIAGFVFASGSSSGQTLARPGWVGSGMTAQTWFRHAIIYRIDINTFQDSDGDGIGDLKGVTERLDYVRSLGVDAILLAPLTSSSVGCSTTVAIGRKVSKIHCVSSGKTSVAATGSAAPLINPAFGTLDDLDDLILQASQLKIRVLLDLPNPDPSLARFWLARGVAGFHVPALNTSGQPNAVAIQAIRKLLPSYVGQRLLITDADAPADSANAASAARTAGNELVLDTALLKLPAPSTQSANAVPDPQSARGTTSTPAGQLRSALEEAQTMARPKSLLLAADAPGVPHSMDRFAAGDSTPEERDALSRIVLTMLMLSRSGVLLSAGQELGLPAASGAAIAIPWGAPPAATSQEQLAGDQPASGKTVAPARPTVSDVYVPYVAPKPAAKPTTGPPPDPASVAGQELDPKSPLSFYLQLNQLRHQGTALRDGDETYLDFDALNALVWVRKPASPSYANPPVLVLCNLSDKPLAIDLKPELMLLRLRGSFLKTVLRSDGGMGAMDLSPVRIPPYGVYIGELKF